MAVTFIFNKATVAPVQLLIFHQTIFPEKETWLKQLNKAKII
jgi:hypothetical protein